MRMAAGGGQRGAGFSPQRRL